MADQRIVHAVRDVAVGLAVAWMLAMAHHWGRIAAVAQATGSWSEGDGGPWSRGPGGPTGPMWPEVAWDPYGTALAVVIGAAIALRHCAPRVAAGVVALASAGYLASGGPLIVALVAPAIAVFTLARMRPSREWWIPVAVGIPVLWVAQWGDPGWGLAQPMTYLQIALGLAVIMVPALVRVMRLDRHAAQEARRDEELRRVADTERLRLARDVHDVVGHSLSMISLQAGVALHVIDKNPDQVRQSLQAIRDASRSSLAELRHTLGALRSDGPAELAPTPDLRSVTDLVDGVRAAGRQVGLSIDGDTTAVPAAQQQAAYRIVQESLTNAVRHAPGAEIAVVIDISAGQLALGVTDTGTGRPRTAVEARTVTEAGHGLRGITERVAALGGTVRYGHRESGGFSVHAEIPLPPTPRSSSPRPPRSSGEGGPPSTPEDDQP